MSTACIAIYCPFARRPSKNQKPLGYTPFAALLSVIIRHIVHTVGYERDERYVLTALENIRPVKRLVFQKHKNVPNTSCDYGRTLIVFVKKCRDSGNSRAIPRSYEKQRKRSMTVSTTCRDGANVLVCVLLQMPVAKRHKKQRNVIYSHQKFKKLIIKFMNFKINANEKSWSYYGIFFFFLSSPLNISNNRISMDFGYGSAGTRGSWTRDVIIMICATLRLEFISRQLI